MIIIKSLKQFAAGILLLMGMAHAGGIDTLTFKKPICCISKTTPTLDTQQFGLEIHNALKQTGYVMQLQKGGNTIHQQYWGWARIPYDGGVPWSPDVPMNIASISKLITAIGWQKTVNDFNSSIPDPLGAIGLDTKIIEYLPSHWAKGSNIEKITFGHLLRHTSGFSTELANYKLYSDRVDYDQMKKRVAIGVPIGNYNSPGLGKYNYENINFSIFRILVPMILHRAALLNQNNDYLLDMSTQLLYTQYMQEKIFNPAGVTGARTGKTSNTALGYRGGIPAKKYNTFDDILESVMDSGNDSGDWTASVGGSSWHMSVNELLKVMHTFRREAKYMTNQQAISMLNDKRGIDQILETVAGRTYNKNGSWGSKSKGWKEQSVVYILPGDMELAVYVNSPIYDFSTFPFKERSLRGLVFDAYKNNLK